MHQHRFLHGDCRGGNYKFRLHFRGDRDGQHLLADSIMLGLGVMTADEIVPLLNQLYAAENGVEMTVVKGSIDFGPEDHPYGVYTVEYEVKTPAIVDEDKLRLTVEYHIRMATTASAVANALASWEIIVVDLVVPAERNGHNGGFFSRRRSGEARLN